ncbi:MAG: BNR repeat-containing protein [Bacteroidales bacterium]|nr:BNR repeat-containing protein [Bacteroidales bacterium]
MVKRIVCFFLIIVFTLLTGQLHSQNPVGYGWAKNSINVPVFRKNSVVTFNGIQYTAFYDSNACVVLAKRHLGEDKWETNITQYKGDVKDAHRSISIGIDGNGYLHMAWDHHNNALNYCIGKEPGSLIMGTKTEMIGSLEDDVTYPEFFILADGNMIFMYRYGISGRGNLVINKYDIKTKTWSRLHDVLISGENVRNAYWQSCVDKNGTIHVSWVWRETWDVSTNHDMCYAKSTDGGVTWTKSNGDVYTIPITASTAEYVSRIPQKSELINQTSMYADSDGHPYICSYWTPEGSTIPQYHLIYYSDTAWKTLQISNRATPFSLSGGGTKKIPISRPQLVVDDRYDSIIVYLIYRDEERGSKVSVNKSLNTDLTKWAIYDLTDFPVYSWEPSYDTELWKGSMILNIFVLAAGQGDGEKLEDLPAQPVYIIGIPWDISPKDCFYIR